MRRALVIMPPLIFSSEAVVALSFLKALKEFGIADISCVYEKEPDTRYLTAMPKNLTDVLSDTKTLNLKLIKGPLISPPLNYFSLKSTALLKRFDYILNLYFREYPIGMNINYVLYPHPLLHKTNKVREKYIGLKSLYFSLGYSIVRKLAISGRLICSSEYIRRVLRETQNTECEVLYPPIIPKEDLKVREKMDLVVGIGKYLPLKRWEEFIEIAKRVKSVNSRIEFKIIGGLRSADSSMDYFRRLKELATGSVELLTDVSEKEKWEILSEAKVVLHSQRIDNFGLGIAEAMYAGAVPVLYRSTGPWQDNVKEGKYGLAYSSVEEAAEHILRLAGDERYFKFLSSLSKERAELFSFSKFRQKIFRILEEGHMEK